MATPLMGMDLPTVGITIGPTWASNLNTALLKVDSHDHTSGNGSLIPTNGLNINADLSFGGYNLITARSVRLSPQGSALALALDKECVYSVNGSLYYNNSSGTAVQITSGAGLNLASVGTIGGDYGGVGVNATVTYNNTSKTYNFLQAAAQTAKMAAGEYLLYETATSTNAVSLKSPASLATSYSVTFPATVPGATKFLRMTSAGVIQNDMDVDNSTVEISGSTVRVKALGITSNELAASSVVNAKIADGTIAKAKQAAVGHQISSSSGTSTSTSTSFVDVVNQSVTITTVGRPVVIMVLPTSTAALIGITGSGFGAGGTVDATSNFQLLRGATPISINSVKFKGLANAAGDIDFYVTNMVFFDAPTAGTYTYKLQYNRATSGAGTSSAVCSNVQLVAWEQ